MDEASIFAIRIDIPLRSTFALLFVYPPEQGRDAWWRALWDYLSSLAPARLEWEYEPVQDVHVARCVLSEEQRRDVVRFLRTAPAEEVANHRTLRRAVELEPEQETRVKVVYFSSRPSGSV